MYTFRSSAMGQLLIKSETKHYSEGTVIADSGDAATGLMVITSGLVSMNCVRKHILYMMIQMFILFLPIMHNFVSVCSVVHLFNYLHSRSGHCQVGVEIPIDSAEADLERQKGRNNLLYVFGRG